MDRMSESLPERPVQSKWECQIVSADEWLVQIRATEIGDECREEFVTFARSEFPADETLDIDRRLTLTYFEQADGLPDYDLQFVPASEPPTQEEIDQALREADRVFFTLNPCPKTD